MVLPFFFYPGLAFCDTDQYPCTLSAAYGQHWRHIKPFYHCPHGCTILQHLDGLATSGSFKCHLAHQIVPNPQNRSKKTWFRCILIEFLYAHDRSVTLIWIWFWGNTKHKWENSVWVLTNQVSFAWAITQDIPLKNTLYNIHHLCTIPHFSKKYMKILFLHIFEQCTLTQQRLHQKTICWQVCLWLVG